MSNESEQHPSKVCATCNISGMKTDFAKKQWKRDHPRYVAYAPGLQTTPLKQKHVLNARSSATMTSFLRNNGRRKSHCAACAMSCKKFLTRHHVRAIIANWSSRETNITFISGEVEVTRHCATNAVWHMSKRCFVPLKMVQRQAQTSLMVLLSVARIRWSVAKHAWWTLDFPIFLPWKEVLWGGNSHKRSMKRYPMISWDV